MANSIIYLIFITSLFWVVSNFDKEKLIFANHKLRQLFLVAFYVILYILVELFLPKKNTSLSQENLLVIAIISIPAISSILHSIYIMIIKIGKCIEDRDKKMLIKTTLFAGFLILLWVLSSLFINSGFKN